MDGGRKVRHTAEKDTERTVLNGGLRRFTVTDYK